MAIPLFPFLLGVATGAAVTYMVSNSGARKRLRNAAEDMGDAVQAQAETVKTAVSDTADEATATVKDAASKVAG